MRDRDTERARDGPKRHTNYGPSSPASIPTPGESLAQIWVAQWRIQEDVASFYFNSFFGAVWGCRAAKSSLK